MKQCWEDDPKHRPRMDSVVFTFRRLNGGRQDFYYILPYLSNGTCQYYKLFGKGLIIIRKIIYLFKLHNRALNVLDNMVTKLEKYAENLENLVSQRTKDLVEEKAKTDELLNRILPP